MAFYIHLFTKRSTKLSTQGQIVNILGIVSHRISVVPVQLYHCTTQQATARTSDHRAWSCSNKTLFTERGGRLDLAHGLLCQRLWYMRGKQKPNKLSKMKPCLSACLIGAGTSKMVLHSNLVSHLLWLKHLGASWLSSHFFAQVPRGQQWKL